MSVFIHAVIAQSSVSYAAPRSAGTSLALGFFILGMILVLAMAVAYLLGTRRAGSKSAQHCPKCNSIRRGEFCAVCGTKF